MKKNRILSVLVSTAIVLTAAGCGGSTTSSKPAPADTKQAPAKTADAPAKQDNTKLQHIVIPQSSQGFLYTPIYIARDKGFFKEQGLEVETVITGGGSKVMAAVIGGSAEAGATAMSSAIDATKKGQAVLSFASLMNQYASNMVLKADIAKQKGVTETSKLEDKINALKGLKIGITSPGSGSDRLVRVLLKKAGLNPDKDVQLVPVGDNAAMVTAFKQNKIDAFCLSSPTAEVSVKESNGMMLLNLSKGELPELNGCVYITLVAKKDNLEKNPELYKKIYTAITKAEEFIAKDKEGTKKIMQANLSKVAPDIFEKAFENNYDAFAKTPEITQKGFDMNAMFSEVKGDLSYDQATFKIK